MNKKNHAPTDTPLKKHQERVVQKSDSESSPSLFSLSLSFISFRFLLSLLPFSTSLSTSLSLSLAFSPFPSTPIDYFFFATLFILFHFSTLHFFQTMGFTKTFSDGSTPEIAIIGGG
jgi:hypothetical protein